VVLDAIQANDELSFTYLKTTYINGYFCLLVLMLDCVEPYRSNTCVFTYISSIMWCDDITRMWRSGGGAYFL